MEISRENPGTFFPWPGETTESGNGIVLRVMNGEALRTEQGYPLRLVVPGWEGNLWVKWRRRIEVGDQPYASKDEAVHYIDLLPGGLHRGPTGSVGLLSRSADTLARGQAVGLSQELIVLLLVMSALFLSFRTGLLSLVPNVVPILALFAVMGFAGIDLNISTAMIAAIRVRRLMSPSTRSRPHARSGSPGVRRLSRSCVEAVSYTHLRAHETVLDLVCRLLLEKKK